MVEEIFEEVFRQYAEKIISKVGKNGLYSDVIHKIGKKLFKTMWNGANSVDKVKFKSGYQIVNLDTSKQNGSHWVSLYIKGNNAYIYDSFARSSKTILKSLVKELKIKKYKIYESDRKDKEQRDSSKVCGQLSIAWLYVVLNYGTQNAMKI